LFVIALVALAVRIVPVLTKADLGWAMEPNGDSATYIGLANGLKHGCGFAWWAGTRCDPVPETNRTPGYALFLALMPGLRAALIAQGLLWSLLCFLVGDFTSTVAGPRAGYCAAGIIAADVTSVVCSNEIMSETLFTALLVGAALAELEVLKNVKSRRKVYYLLATVSALLGLALLVRPIAECVIPIFILAPMLLEGPSRRRKALMALLVAAGPLVCGTAWTLRNYSVAHVAAISTIAGLNFFYYRAVGTLAFASHAGWAETLARTHLLRNSDLSAQAYRIIAHHPFAFIGMTLWSFIYLCWVPDRTPLARFLGIPSILRFEDPGSVRIEALVHKLLAGNLKEFGAVSAQQLYSSTVLLLLMAIQILMIAFTWTGVTLALKKYGRAGSSIGRCVLFAFAIAIVTLLLASGPEAVARFRTPATPLLAFLTGVGWFGNRTTGSFPIPAR
jgi:hypothetical protein